MRRIVNHWPTNLRRAPYSEVGIRRRPCVRCGARAEHQWNVCALPRSFHPLCVACDVALNRLVLEWAGHPDARALGDAYAVRQGVV